jgi:hypothetical protein
MNQRFGKMAIGFVQNPFQADPRLAVNPVSAAKLTPFLQTPSHDLVGGRRRFAGSRPLGAGAAHEARNGY